MHSRELTTGRTFGVRFHAEESYFSALEELLYWLRHGTAVTGLARQASAAATSACRAR